MKKKILCMFVLAFALFGLGACKSKDIDINNYLIEERLNLFVASDETYLVTFSSGRREQNYDLDGKKNDLVDFGVITLSQLDHNKPSITGECNFTLVIDDRVIDGKLLESSQDNTYSVDIGERAENNSIITIQLEFNGTTFSKKLENVTDNFNVDKDAAIKIANSELQEELQNFKKDNKEFEAVMKIVKDYSSEETQEYYWYVGVISTNGETIGILIDANSGDVIAKKV